MKAKLLVTALVLLAPFALVVPDAQAKPRAAPHYDCSKAGNVNKAQCNADASSASPASTVAHADAPKARNYDCSKAGNKNKTVCKSASSTVASAASPATASTMAVPKTRNYDCSKAGNANKAVCKTTMASAPAPAANENIPTPSHAMPASRASTPAVAVVNGAPTGATAQCKDNTYSMSQHHSGTCSHHGGVKQWLH